MESADHCRFLQDGPVAICTAFTGGLRTPREVELEDLCRSKDHPRCPYFVSRMRAERERAAGGQGVGTRGRRASLKEVP